MDAMKRLLQDDLNRLTDRIATALRSDTTAAVGSRNPDLYERLEAASGGLADLREELVGRYAAWLVALDDCAALWEEAERQGDGVTLDRAA